MTIEVALKILELNVICSPKATEFKEAVEVITKELKYQNEVIEKKQTEYEIVRKSAVSWMNKCKKLQAEIEKLSDRNRKCIYLSDDETTEYCVDAICPKFRTEKQIKSEARKEYAERLTDEICDSIERSMDNPDGCNYVITDVYKDIENLLKEMDGET